ncbi:hypothetical protein [Bacillus marinisedimentorum]|uniref:hypothetical protein n=1 Tax=Bacillus marinisedimentorum TaxID=1821260 RepID=UPI00087284AC|nr:hypothetical protein [Bacillus marinisedimentorum]
MLKRNIAAAFSIYANHFGSIFILSLSLLLPLMVLHNVIANAAYLEAARTGLPAAGDLLNSFLMFLFLIVGQVPFIRFAGAELREEEQLLKPAFLAFFTYGFPVYIFALLFTMMVLAGFAVFVIPGIILIVLFFLTPYIAVLRGQPVFRSMKPGLQLGIRKFFPLLLLIVLLSLTELVIGTAGMIGITRITDSYLAVVLSEMLLNLLFFPFFVILLTLQVHHWEKEETFAGSWLKKAVGNYGVRAKS